MSCGGQKIILFSLFHLNNPNLVDKEIAEILRVQYFAEFYNLLFVRVHCFVKHFS